MVVTIHVPPLKENDVTEEQISRWCKRGWKNGMDMYRAIREGIVRKRLGKLEERTGKLANKEQEHVYKCLDGGKDWYKKERYLLMREDWDGG